jgi:methionine biosynthesis protein MetW
MRSDGTRLDFQIILQWVQPGSAVLDLGCGDGDLLELLVRAKGVKAQGIEINEQAIYRCVAKGLSVFHDDLDRGLSEYGDKTFDYVILNQTLQQVRKLDEALQEALRVGREVIVGFPNFAHWSARVQLFFRGHTPITPALPYEWHDTPNLHFLSLLDFTHYCQKRQIQIRRAAFLGEKRMIRFRPILLAQAGIFLISHDQRPKGD